MSAPDGSIGTVGISGREAVGQILAGGVRDMSSLGQQALRPGLRRRLCAARRQVAVHLEKPLAIDFDPEGRKVDHRAGETMLSRRIAGPLALASPSRCSAAAPPAKEKLLTHGDRTMMDIWQQERRDGGGGAGQEARRQLLDARQSLRRPLTEMDMQAAPAEQMRYTRTARNEVHRQFQRLPNPDLVMYVYPHLAGTDPVPVPGYTTVFPLYQRAFSTPCRVSAWRTTDALETPQT